MITQRSLRHLYVVYKDDLGEEYVIRGGPESLGPIPSAPNADGEGFGRNEGFGRIVVESGDPLSTSADRRDGQTPYQRYQVEIDLDGRDAADVWEQMVNRGDEIGAANFDYDVVPIDGMQNSNSVVSSVLHSAGIDVELR